MQLKKGVSPDGVFSTQVHPQPEGSGVRSPEARGLYQAH